MKNLAKLLMSLIILSLLGVASPLCSLIFCCKNHQNFKNFKVKSQNNINEPKPKLETHARTPNALSKSPFKQINCSGVFCFLLVLIPFQLNLLLKEQ